MAEKRMLARVVSQSRKVNSLSLKAALLWTWCVPWFDVSGFLEVEPDFLKANVVLRRKDITEEEIPFLVTEIIDAGLWEEFISSEGKRVVKEIKFFDFQNVRETHEAKSKFTDSVKKITTKRRRKTIPYEIREEVFKRDKYVCQYCGIKCTIGFGIMSYDNDFQSNSRSITLDHKIPISKGGDDSIENLVTACFHCNASKYNRTLTDDKPTTDQLQTKDVPTPAQDKINEVKLSEVKRREIKAGSPLSFPITQDQKKELATLCAQVSQKFKDQFNPWMWIQKNITLNPQTHIHVMKAMATNSDIKDPWPYANQIALIEDGVYNAKDFQAKSEKDRSIFNEIITDLKKLHGEK